jgi:secreted trypsin-like serine protease
VRRIFVVSALAILMASTLAAPSGAIVFGEPDEDLHPNVGTMVVEWEPGVVSTYCSGTLIAPTVFLTAAHCTAEVLAMGMERVGVSFDTVFDPVTATVSIGTIHQHPGYDALRHYSDPHDLAVVVFDDPVPGITPAQLPTLGLLDSLSKEQLRVQRFTAVGYGRVRDSIQGGWKENELTQARHLAEQGFRSLQRSWLVLDMLPHHGNGGTCFGDSGGPHFLGERTSNLIVSITVGGDAVCKATDQTYRVDTASARAFLADFVQLP